MPEPSRPIVRAVAVASGVGLLLAVLTGWPGVPAVLGAWLAQPALAVALSWRQRTRALPANPGGLLRRDLLPLLAVWGAGGLAAAVLLAWPLHGLLRQGALAGALLLSGGAGVLVIGLWWTWPLWQRVEREGGPLAQAWAQSRQREPAQWSGLAVAAAVAGVLAGAVCLAWPALLPSHARIAAVVLYVLALPALHLVVQRARQAAGLPVVEMAAPRSARVAVAPAPLAPQPARPPERPAGPRAIQALYEAARAGRVEAALELLEAGVPADTAPPADSRDQRSLAALAAVLPDLRLLRALIARGVDLNDVRAGMTPLLAATRDSWHGRPDAVTTLLANGADPRQADHEGNTPLHHAARSSDPGVAALLRDAAADLDALNRDGVSPLGIACAAGNWRLARYLLERGARPEPPAGQPVLLRAAAPEEDDAAGVQLLLRHKARASARDARQRTALHEAAQAGHAGIVQALLQAGAEVGASDAQGRTPWLDAARAGHLPVLELLATAGADRSGRDAGGRDALLLAVQAEVASPALVERLLELGLDPAARDAGGQRAADLAAAAGRWALVSLLDADYPLPSAVAAPEPGRPLPDKPPLTLVREALEAGSATGLGSVLALCSAAELGSLLHAPGLAQDPGKVAWLLAHGADGQVRDPHSGDTALLAAMARGPAGLAVARACLRAGQSPAGGRGLARYLAACSHAQARADRQAEGFMLELLDAGADPFAGTITGDRALALAVRLGWQVAARTLLDRGCDPDAPNSRGLSALHLATALGEEAMVRLLVARGANPGARAADGQTPLGVALANGRRDLADWLDWRGWPLPRRALQAADLPAAAMAGDADAVRRLLALGFAVDAVDSQGCTALLRAAGGGHGDVMALLLQRGADPQHAAHTGATPLSAAVSMRQVAIVEALLAAGADIESRLPGGVTVLMLASALGLPDIAARLLVAGADVHAADSQGLTALHCACLFGFIARDRDRLLALVDTLLLAGANPEGDTAVPAPAPLLLLLGARAEPGTACQEDVVLAALERMLDEDVPLDVQDARGFGPLHLAALHGLLSVVRRLLRAGADLDLRDALGRRPREIAIMRGFIDVAGELAPPLSGDTPAAWRHRREWR